jgi:PAS domain S-box-containing protein
LTADNARLRRHALILSYLPDPVIAIGLDGKIKFCNVQVARVLKHKIEDLEGASIKGVLVPESRPAMRRLIQDLVAAEQVVAAGFVVTDSGSGDNGEGNNSGGSTNAVSGSSDQSFTVKEVDVNGHQENVSDSSRDPSGKKNVSDRVTSHRLRRARPP